MSSLFYILGAALVSSAAPVAIAFYADYDYFQVFADFLLFKALLFTFFLWVPVRNWRRHGGFFKDRPLVALAVFQYLLYVGSVVALGAAFQEGRSISAVLLYESWPILLAVIFPLFVSRDIARLSGTDVLLLGVGMVGVGFIVYGYLQTPSPDAGAAGQGQPGNLTGLWYALLALVLLAVSTALKARYVRLAAERHGVGAFLSFAYMQMAAIPVALPLLLVPSAAGDFFSALGGARPFAEYSPTLALVAINVLSAILFSYGSLKMRFASENLIWFLTPIFTLILFFLILGVTPKRYEYVGAMLVLCANILTHFKLENTASFAAAYLGFVGFGVLCIYVDGVGADNYFEMLSVLVIFFSILLSAIFQRLTERRKETHAAALAVLDALEEADAAARAPVSAVLASRSPSALHEAYQAAAAALEAPSRERANAPSTRTLRGAVERYALARRFGLGVSEVFILLKLGAVAMFCAVYLRGADWWHDLFAFSFAASVLFALAITFQYARDAALPIFRLEPTAPGDDPTPRLITEPGPAARERVIWVILLSAIVYTCLGLCFYQYS
ncbi:MAG: hypothetical protein AAF909_14225 [Pseudomonadota bacterium]